ncbi:hypothetical protein I316_00243 [Kwoniella heveanensis BCC8398]|uniref:Peptidase A1 domain-containing protein n=1 Tax=Kwoniella heveanensis BCC8398 TaxID=1296120 RepID=A0A1B9H434_9TREE|nr:hypothetical protein I316_00243 [Kwoniella heveanensis BCC8398]
MPTFALRSLLLLLPLLTLLVSPVEGATTLKLSRHTTSSPSRSLRKVQQRSFERRRRDEPEDRAIHIAMHPHHTKAKSHGGRRNGKRRLDGRSPSRGSDKGHFDGLSGVLEGVLKPDSIVTLTPVVTAAPDGDGDTKGERSAPPPASDIALAQGDSPVPEQEVGNVIISSVYRTVTKTIHQSTPVAAPTGVPEIENPDDLELENTGGLAYTIDVVVGGVAIPVIVDTGSSQFWVPASTCISCTSYGMTVSPIQLPESCESRNNTYGIGSVSGCFTKSAISVGPYEIPNMDLMGVTTVDEALGSSGSVLSGILGLAGETTLEGAPTVVKAMYDLGLIKSKTVGFYLSEDENVDSEITFGDVTTSEHADASQGVTVQSVENDMNLYEIVMDEFAVGGTVVTQSETVVVDTGSSYIYVPEATAQQIYSLLPSPLKAEQGYLLPCAPDNPPTLKLKFGGMDFPLEYKYIVGDDAGTGDGYCWGKIGSLAKMNSWVIGDAFLHTVYTSFNVETREVTIYKLK